MLSVGPTLMEKRRKWEISVNNKCMGSSGVCITSLELSSVGTECQNLYISVWMSWLSLVAQMVNNLPAMWETQVWSLGQEDPLEKGMANHASILVWRIPWVEEPGGLQSTGSQRVGHNWVTEHTRTSLHSLWKILLYPCGEWEWKKQMIPENYYKNNFLFEPPRVPRPHFENCSLA